MPGRFPTILVPSHIQQSDLSALGIPGVIEVAEGGERLLQLEDHAVNEHFELARRLLASSAPEAPSNETERQDRTNAWLMLKSCLDALPPPPEEGSDPFEAARSRLQAEVDAALILLDGAGGAL
jgi:hypothetical protein